MRTTFSKWMIAGLGAAGLFAAAPAAAAETAWGAISVDLSATTVDAAYGIGGGDTEAEAVENGQKFCAKSGGASCKSVVSYQRCGAFATNGHDGGWGKAPTKKEAEASAMRACEKGDCQLLVADCN
jgi:uncharacterized protein DUF4189